MNWEQKGYSADTQQLCLTKNEVKILAQLLEGVRKKLEKRLEALRDKHESGELSERGQTAMLQLDDKLEVVEKFLLQQ